MKQKLIRPKKKFFQYKKSAKESKKSKKQKNEKCGKIEKIYVPSSCIHKSLDDAQKTKRE